jgi:hypothetical protein
MPPPPAPPMIAAVLLATASGEGGGGQIRHQIWKLTWRQMQRNTQWTNAPPFIAPLFNAPPFIAPPFRVRSRPSE